MSKQKTDFLNFPVIQDFWNGINMLGHCLDDACSKHKLEIDTSLTFVSRHMWHGYDLLDDHGAAIPSAKINLGDSGFSGQIIGVFPLSSGYEESVEMDFAAFYSGSFLEDTAYFSKYTVNYFYYGKPNQSDQKGDTQELGIRFCWPSIISVGEHPVVPSYYFGSIWSAKSHSANRGCEGFIHVFGVGSKFGIPEPIEREFKLYANITYNDGFGSASADSDWSHAVIGVNTDLVHGDFSITPSLNYQISMDDSINREEELWCTINLNYRF